jgi:hypothetical protein
VERSSSHVTPEPAAAISNPSWIRRRGGLLLLLVASVGYGFSAVHRQLGTGNDLPIFLDAGRTLLAGSSPYDVGAGLNGYVYLPFLALLLAPLALLPQTAATVVWYAANIVLTVGVFRLVEGLLNHSIGQRTRRGVLVISLIVTSRFFLANYDLGQVNILILLLLLLAARSAILDRRDARAGALIGLAAAIKPNALLLLGPFLIRRHWRVGLGAVAAGLTAVLLLPALLLGPSRTRSLLQEWHAQVVAPSVQGALQGSSVQDQSPHAALRRWVLDEPAFGDTHVNVVRWSESRYRTATRVLQLSLLAFFCSVWFARRAQVTRGALLTDVALALCAMLTVIGYNLKAHFVLLLLPWTLLAACADWERGRGGRSRRLLSILLLAGALILFSSPGTVGRTGSNWALAHSSVMLATLLLVAGLLLVRRRPDAPHPDPTRGRG